MTLFMGDEKVRKDSEFNMTNKYIDNIVTLTINFYAYK